MADFRYVVYDTRIHEMFVEGGSVHRWTGNFARDVERAAIRRCPVARQSWGLNRTPGALRMSHRSTVGSNQYTCIGSVYNTRYYARWVHNGTDTISVKRAEFMIFYINGRRFAKKTVSGQRAQPWLAEALAEVASLHGI